MMAVKKGEEKMDQLILESTVKKGVPLVCILGPEGEGELSCYDLKEAISSKSVDCKFEATGVIFKNEEISYRVVALSMEPIILLKRLLQTGRIQIEPFKKLDLCGFSIAGGD